MSRKIYRADIDYRSAGVTSVLRFATETLERPQDTGLAVAHVDGRLTQLLFEQTLFQPGMTRGDMTIGRGVITVANQDGELDYLATSGYVFDNQPFRVYATDVETGVDTFFWSGLVESALLNETEVTFTIRDVSYQFDMAFQPVRYAGNNVLPNGLEGNSDDLQGKVKPVVIGSVFNATPPMVNTSYLIYQLTQGKTPPLATLTVYDSGVPLTAGLALASLASLDSGFTAWAFTAAPATDICTTTVAHGYATGDPVTVTTTGALPAPLVNTAYYYVRVLSAPTFTLHPTAADAMANTNIVNITTAGTGAHDVAKNRTAQGCYDFYNDLTAAAKGFFIRLGSRAVGQVTFTWIHLTANTLLDTLLMVRDRLLTVIPSVSLKVEPVMILESAPSPAVANQRLGVFVDEPTTFHRVLQDLVAGLNCFFFGYPNIPANDPSLLDYRTYGYLIVNRIKYPIVDAPVFTITKDNLVPNTLRRLVSDDEDRGVPAWRVNAAYLKNETVMNASEVPGATTQYQGFVAEEFRTLVADNAVNLSDNPLAPEINFSARSNSHITNVTALAAYLLALYGQATDIITLQVPLDDWFEVSTTVDPTNTLPIPHGKGPYPGSLLGRPIAMDSALRFARTRYLLGYRMDLEARAMTLTLWG